MIPILFDSSEELYTSHGLGELSEATSCEVEEEANGAYQLTMQLPITARHYKDIERRFQILAKSNPTDRPQPFRIYRVTKPLRGVVTVFARHVSYDLTGVVIGPLAANTAAEAVAQINSRALTQNAFTFSTDLAVSGELKTTVPTSARALLGPVDKDGTLLRVYGGDLRFDRRAVQLLAHRGADRGFEIAYGVNMTELRADEDSGEVYAGILPYWTDGETLVQGDVQSVPPSTGPAGIRPVDLSTEFAEKPTVAEVNAHGAAWLDRNKPYLPRDSYSVSFVPPGSRGLHTLEQLSLFDEVTVRYDRLGVRVKKTVVKTDFDVLRERYRSVKIGERRVYVADLLAAPISAKRLVPGSVGRAALSAGVKFDVKDAKNTASAAATAAADANTLAATANTAANTAKETTDKVDAAFSFENGVITAKEWIYAPRVYANQFYVDYGDTTGSVNNHTHFYTVDSQTGEVTPGRPDFTGASHPFNIADTQFYQARVSAITTTAITAARETADANIYWDATNHTLSADYTLTAKNAADSPVYNERAYTITIPADKAYQAGYADGGGGGGTHSIDFGSGVRYNTAANEFRLTASCSGTSDTYAMTPSLGWSGAPNEWNTPQTNWMRVWRYVDLNGVASQDFAIDIDMSSQISGAYNSGHAAGYSSGYSAGSGAVTVSQVLGYGAAVARLELSNGSRWRIEADGTITRLN